MLYPTNPHSPPTNKTHIFTILGICWKIIINFYVFCYYFGFKFKCFLILLRNSNFLFSSTNNKKEIWIVWGENFRYLYLSYMAEIYITQNKFSIQLKIWINKPKGILVFYYFYWKEKFLGHGPLNLWFFYGFKMLQSTLYTLLMWLGRIWFTGSLLWHGRTFWQERMAILFPL